MAYTYDDFTRAAEEAGLTGSFDQSDLDIARRYPEYGLSLVSLKRDLNNAATDEQRLLVTEAANQLRSNYSGLGAKSTPAQSYAGGSGSGQSAAGENSYETLLNQIINHGSFSWDPSQDENFSAYKKAYNREGDRAAANALATAAAATGGRASSYAQTAAQQAGNYYAGKLADIIPELRSQAMNEYNNEYEQLLSSFGAAAADRDREKKLQDENYGRLLSLIAAGYAPNSADYLAAGLTAAQGKALYAAYKPQQRSSGRRRVVDKNDPSGDDNDKDALAKYEEQFLKEQEAERNRAGAVAGGGNNRVYVKQ